MRLLVLALLTSSAVASASPDPAVTDRSTDFLPSVALRAGFLHTHVDKDEGEPSGVGPKLELEVSSRPLPFVIVAAVAGYSHYATGDIHDAISSSSYRASFGNTWLGGRLYVRPHWRAFLGLGVFSMREHEQTSGTVINGELSHRETVVDALVGVNLGWIHGFAIQVAATGTQYSQYHDLEHVTSWGLLCGVMY